MSSELTRKKLDVQTMVGLGVLTAIVIVLQAVASQIKFGTFSITLVLAPIVIGAAMYGWKAGTWLGLVFGIMVLISGDAAPFMTVNAPGTVITVLLKGALAGLAAGLVYKLLENRNQWIAVICAGVICPVVNTGIFLIGCRVFFWDTIKEWGAGTGYSNVGKYILFGLVGTNFLVELGINMVLSTAIVRILNAIKKPSGNN